MICGYFSIEALGSPYNYFYDGVWYYTRSNGISGLTGVNGLHGFLKKIGRKIKKVAKKTVKVVRKVAKKGGSLAKKGVKLYAKGAKAVGKGLKKVGKAAIKVIHKALPIVNTALAFVPGVGWAVSAALTVAEMGLNAAKKAYDRKKAKELAKRLNKEKTVPVTPAKPVKKFLPAKESAKRSSKGKVTFSSAPEKKVVVKSVVQRTKASGLTASEGRKSRVQFLTIQDLLKIQNAVQRKTVSPEYVAALANKEVYGSLSQILRS